MSGFSSDILKSAIALTFYFVKLFFKKFSCKAIWTGQGDWRLLIKILCLIRSLIAYGKMLIDIGIRLWRMVFFNRNSRCISLNPSNFPVWQPCHFLLMLLLIVKTILFPSGVFSCFIPSALPDAWFIPLPGFGRRSRVPKSYTTWNHSIINGIIVSFEL